MNAERSIDRSIDGHSELELRSNEPEFFSSDDTQSTCRGAALKIGLLLYICQCSFRRTHSHRVQQTMKSHISSSHRRRIELNCELRANLRAALHFVLVLNEITTKKKQL